MWDCGFCHPRVCLTLHQSTFVRWEPRHRASLWLHPPPPSQCVWPVTVVVVSLLQNYVVHSCPDRSCLVATNFLVTCPTLGLNWMSRWWWEKYTKDNNCGQFTYKSPGCWSTSLSATCHLSFQVILTQCRHYCYLGTVSRKKAAIILDFVQMRALPKVHFWSIKGVYFLQNWALQIWSSRVSLKGSCKM